MRKLLLTFISFAAIVAAAVSCANEIDPEGAIAGAGEEVTFKVFAPEDVMTKAISDGQGATQLEVAVYDEAGAYLANLTAAMQVTGNSPWSVTVPVVKDLTYQFVFFAHNADDNGFYTFNASEKTLKVDYGKLASNDDKADAFYSHVKFKVENTFTKEITLRRPLAQLNIGASDLTAASYSIDVTSINLGVELTGIYDTMNLLDSTVTNQVDVSYAKALRVTEATQFVEGFDRIGMVYALVDQAVTSSATINITANGAGTATEKTITRSVSNVPLKRNYRTNILGTLFTNIFTFTVTTDPGFYHDAYSDVNVPDYYAEANTIDELNALFADGILAATLKVDDGVSGTVILPNVADSVYLNIIGDFSDDNITLAYGTKAKPTTLFIYAPNLFGLSGNLPETHVIINPYSHIDEGTLYVSNSTLVIKPKAYYGRLVMMQGSLLVEAEGYIDTARIDKSVKILDADKPLDERATVAIEEDATVIKLIIEDLSGNASIKGKVDTVEVSCEVAPGATAPTVSIEPTATVETLEQKDDAKIDIAEGAKVEEVEAEKLDHISGEGAAEVEFLIRSEEDLRTVLDAGKNKGKLGNTIEVIDVFTLSTPFALNMNNCNVVFKNETSFSSADVFMTDGNVIFDEVPVSKLTLSAGVFDSVSLNLAEGETDKRFISGGFFKVAPEEYILEGKGCVLLESGLYEVIDAVAQINDTIHGSLESAFAAAQPGETVVLLVNITLSDDITVPGKVTLLVQENLEISGDATLSVLGTLNNEGTVSCPVDVLTEVYTVEEQTFNDPNNSVYAVKATWNGSLTGTAPTGNVVYKISLADGQSWFVDTNNGNTVCVRVDGDNKYLKTSLAPGFLQTDLGTTNDNCTFYLLKDATTYSTNSKANYGPMLSYCGFVFEGNGHTITITAHSSGANSDYSAMKLQNLHDCTVTVKNLTFNNGNYAKHGIDIVPQKGYLLNLNVFNYNATNRKGWGVVLNGNSGKGVAYVNQFGTTHWCPVTTGTGPNNMTMYWQVNNYTKVN